MNDAPEGATPGAEPADGAPAYRAPQAESLLRQAIQLVEEARPMPLSASSMINKEELLAVLTAAAQGLPDELRSARWLLKERDDFLARVAEIFGVDAARFRGLRARFVPDAEPDPWDVLGVAPGTPMPEVRAAWRQLVRDSHPDRMLARGVPEEAVKLAEKRLVAINRAWEEISGKAA